MRSDVHRGLLALTVAGAFLVGVTLGEAPHIAAVSSFLLGVAFLGQALWMRGVGDGSVRLDSVITAGVCGAAVVLLAIPLVAYVVGGAGVLVGSALVVLDDADHPTFDGATTLGVFLGGASVLVLVVTVVLETGLVPSP